MKNKYYPDKMCFGHDFVMTRERLDRDAHPFFHVQGVSMRCLHVHVPEISRYS